MRTPWGYEITATELPDLITLAQFNRITNNRFATATGVADTLSAVSQAVRNACGWHIAPALTCTQKCTAESPFIRLKAMGVSAITSIVDDSTTLAASSYEFIELGLIRRTDGTRWTTKWNGITVTFTAGYEADSLLAQIVAQIAANALAAPAGVREEHAGNVGITYNQWDGLAGGVSLTDRDIEMLAAYRMPQVV